jgi:T4 RnlA family RNA ligase
MYNLENLTYENCLKIIETNENFKMKTTNIEGTEIIQMTYHLAGFEDFSNPFRFSGKDKIEKLDGFEIRGLTFVKREDGTYQRFLMLRKFFNINQTIGNFVEDLKDFKIVRIQDKLDGSLIRFISLNNGKIIPKTKFDLDNDQTELSNKVVESNDNLKNFIKDTIDQNLSANFELISPMNRIVLDYKETELRLLQLRDEITGEHYNIYEHPLVQKYNVPCTKEILNDGDTLEDWVEWAKNTKNKEGVIHLFENGHMAKHKTDWYFATHRAVSSNTLKENILIESVCEDVIDDILSQIPLEHKEKRDLVEKVAHRVSNYINHSSKLAFETVKNEFNPENKKEFAVKYQKHPHFGAFMALTKNNSIDKAEKYIQEYILKNYRNYEKAKEWVDSLPDNYKQEIIKNNELNMN